jgi:CBS domain-containing protein
MEDIMLVGEIMTRDVATVTTDMTVAEVARLFAEKKISGVPVLDGHGVVVGVVSEADLLHRAEIKTERRHSWWSALFETDTTLAREFVRQGARKVSDIMSRNLVTVSEDANLAGAAELLDKHRIKRLVVLRGEKLAGIISRADIVRAIVKTYAAAAGAVTGGSDDSIRQSLTDRMADESWAKMQLVNTHVHDGIVDLTGFVSSEAQKKALRVLAENTPGVQLVRDRTRIYVPPIGAVT